MVTVVSATARAPATPAARSAELRAMTTTTGIFVRTTCGLLGLGNGRSRPSGDVAG
jgi:hypothetical protein